MTNATKQHCRVGREAYSRTAKPNMLLGLEKQSCHNRWYVYILSMNALHRLHHKYQAVIVAPGRTLENTTWIAASNLLVLAGMSEQVTKGTYE